MLGRRALTTAALTSNIIVHVSATLTGAVDAGVSAGIIRPIGLGLAGAVASAATASHARFVSLDLSAGGNAAAAARVARSIDAQLASGANTSVTVGNGIFATLVTSVDAGAATGVVRGFASAVFSGAQTGLTASHARPLIAQLQAGAETALVASSAAWVAAQITGETTVVAEAGLVRVVAAGLAATAASFLRVSHYTPSLIRIYGPVAADWDTPRVLAIWEDMIEEGDILMKDKAMIAGTNAAKVVRLYPDNGDIGGNGISLAGCHSFVAKAKRVDGTGPVLTLSAIIHGDPAQGRVRLEHGTDAFQPGAYEIQISYKDGADHKHAYPDDGESLRLEVMAAIV